MTRAQVDDLAVPSLLITLGSPSERLSAADISANDSDLILKLPKCAHASAPLRATLPRCRLSNQRGFLEEDKDDLVCTDPIGTGRAAVHFEIVEAIGNHFGL